eukprot:CAMPEP_0172521314 /NCGR_PEP_ID=MMETSP1066-20121228/292514_1 /TAXON_ID=671091 /ORGANISM="Coscinodiscus wailesii, Strain CCMP2513" /LENGTH=86 /DNA_ID=CAMNT_0013304213 /DNA_START=961 /DNA_END=1218 /DNA_ORIENTATION=-
MGQTGPDELGIEAVVIGGGGKCGIVVGIMANGIRFVMGWCRLEQRLVVQYVNGFGGYDGAGRCPERDERCCGAGVFMDRWDGDAGT